MLRIAGVLAVVALGLSAAHTKDDSQMSYMCAIRLAALLQHLVNFRFNSSILMAPGPLNSPKSLPRHTTSGINRSSSFGSSHTVASPLVRWLPAAGASVACARTTYADGLAAGRDPDPSPMPFDKKEGLVTTALIPARIYRHQRPKTKAGRIRLSYRLQTKRRKRAPVIL
ncbi:unnamed protein product [Pleuronectes platessa]|uniref:Secreted protein n=1 Tax=Pleuronectes platessa TaxID=8262 RepID=A0A9N7TPC6_PLEPL|nr:unnamed protein product [Pleuronectes platessa]